MEIQPISHTDNTALGGGTVWSNPWKAVLLPLNLLDLQFSLFTFTQARGNTPGAMSTQHKNPSLTLLWTRQGSFESDSVSGTYVA